MLTQFFQTTLSERTRFRYLGGLRVLFTISLTVLWTVLLAVWLETFGGGNSLLYLFFIDSLLFVGGSCILLFLRKRVPHNKGIIVLSIITSLLSILCLSVFISSEYVFITLLLIIKGLLFTPITLFLDALTEELLTASEARIGIPLMKMAMTLGGLIGAGIMLSCISFFSTKDMLFIFSIGSMLMSLMVLLRPYILHEIPHITELLEGIEEPIEPIRKTLQLLYNNSFLRTMAVFIMMMTAMGTLFEVQFLSDLYSYIKPSYNILTMPFGDVLQASLIDYDAIKTTIQQATETIIEAKNAFITDAFTHHSILESLSIFHIFISLIAIVIQLITPFVQSRIGITGTLITFVGFIITAFIGLLTGKMSIGMIRNGYHALHSIQGIPFHTAYYGFPEEHRANLRTIYEEILASIGVLIGIILLATIPQNILFITYICISITFIILLHTTKQDFTKLSIHSLFYEKKLHTQFEAIEMLSVRMNKNILHSLLEKLFDTTTHIKVFEKILHSFSQSNVSDAIPRLLQYIEEHKDDAERHTMILDCMLKYSAYELKTYLDTHSFTRHTLKNILSEMSKNSLLNLHIRKRAIKLYVLTMRSEEAVPFFLELLHTADDLFMAELLKILRTFQDTQIIPYIQCYRHHTSPRIRTRTMLLLWEFSDDITRHHLRRQLKQMIRNGDMETTLSVLYTLGELYDSDSLYLVQDYLGHENSKIRLHSAFAAAKMKDINALDYVVYELLDTPKDHAFLAYKMVESLPSDIKDELEKRLQVRIREELNAYKTNNYDTETLKWYYTLTRHYDDMLYLEHKQAI